VPRWLPERDPCRAWWRSYWASPSREAGGHTLRVTESSPSLQAVEESEDLLVCRLVEGKVTLVHRRLWPALARLERRFSREQLAQIHQEHTPSGKHVNRIVEFPDWVPKGVRAASRRLSAEEAERVLAPVPACARRR